MVTFVLGRAGSGKTENLLQKIAGRAAGASGASNPSAAGGQILLVPEQSGFMTERRLAISLGNGISRSAEVLTFKSLATRVFSMMGFLACTPIDDGGQLLLLRRAAGQVRPHLKIYERHALSAPFLQKALSAIDELKLARVSPEELAGFGEVGLLSDKLHDLSLLYGAYQALLTGDLQDPSDRMTLLATVLEGGGNDGFFAGRHVYIDGFNRFNSAELAILRVVFQTAETVTVALCCDEMEETEGGLGVFSPVRKTAAALLKLCRQEKKEVVIENAHAAPRRFAKGAKAISGLERVLAGVKGPFTEGGSLEPDDSLRLYRAKTPYSEWEFAAGEILRLVQSGLRFGEIAIATRDLSRYADVAAAVFARYGVPFFLDRRESAADRAPLKTAVFAMKAAEFRRKEDILALLKSDFAGLSAEEADALENYMLLWDVSPSAMAKPFTGHPDGFGAPMTEEDAAALERLNALRARLIAPLSLLPSEGTAKELGEGLYRYLLEINLPAAIAAEADRLSLIGALRKAQEYGQLWALLCDALDQIVLILQNARLLREEFCELFHLLLSKRSVGSIPAALDAVSIGEAGRMRPDQPRRLFFLGALDGVFPPEPAEHTILTPSERRRLAEQGLPLDQTDQEQLFSEQLAAYQILTTPSEGLVLSFYEGEITGEAAEPSYYIGKIRQALPFVKLETEAETSGLFRAMAKEPCMALALGEAGRAKTREAMSARAAFLSLPDGAERLALVENALCGRRGPISDRAVIAGLLGERPLVTASRLETFHGCAFSYFARYGLSAKVRKKAELGPADAGSLIHFVLSETATAVSALPGGWKAVSKERLEALAKQHTARYVEAALGGLDDKSARFCWQLSRLSESVLHLLFEMRAEFSQSAFEPFAFELAFGLPGEDARPGVYYEFGEAKILLAGKIDRVDRWQTGTETYLRVVDYKTGHTSFRFADVEAGLGAQLLVYLFALCKTEQAKPAGVLYIPALARFAMGAAGNSGVLRESATRTGLLLNEPDVIAAMEQPDDGKARFIPVSYTGTGEERALRITNSLASGEEFSLLQRHIEGLLEKMAQGLWDGAIECAPLLKENYVRCDQCDMRRICQFDEGRQLDRGIFVEKLDKKAFFQKKREEAAHALDGQAT